MVLLALSYAVAVVPAGIPVASESNTRRRSIFRLGLGSVRSGSIRNSIGPAD